MDDSRVRREVICPCGIQSGGQLGKGLSWDYVLSPSSIRTLTVVRTKAHDVSKNPDVRNELLDHLESVIGHQCNRHYRNNNNILLKVRDVSDGRKHGFAMPQREHCVLKNVEADQGNRKKQGPDDD